MDTKLISCLVYLGSCSAVGNEITSRMIDFAGDDFGSVFQKYHVCACVCVFGPCLLSQSGAQPKPQPILQPADTAIVLVRTHTHTKSFHCPLCPNAIYDCTQDRYRRSITLVPSLHRRACRARSHSTRPIDCPLLDPSISPTNALFCCQGTCILPSLCMILPASCPRCPVCR